MYSAFQETFCAGKSMFLRTYKVGKNPLNSLENIGIQNSNHVMTIHLLPVVGMHWDPLLFISSVTLSMGFYLSQL